MLSDMVEKERLERRVGVREFMKDDEEGALDGDIHGTDCDCGID